VEDFSSCTGIEVPVVFVVGLAKGVQQNVMRAESLCTAGDIGKGTDIEVANYDTGGRVIGYEGGPVRADPEYTTELVSAAHAAVAAAVACSVTPTACPSRETLTAAMHAACVQVPFTLRCQHVATHERVPP